MHLNESMNCCGIREICGLSSNVTSTEAMQDFVERIATVDHGYGPRRYYKFRYAIFSAIGRRKYGHEFEAYILKHKLGEVISTGYHINPNSRHKLKVWVWTVDHVALKAWATAHKPPKTEADSDDERGRYSDY